MCSAKQGATKREHVCSANLAWMKRFLQGACVLGSLFMLFCGGWTYNSWSFFYFCSLRTEILYCIVRGSEKSFLLSRIRIPLISSSTKASRGLCQRNDVDERWMLFDHLFPGEADGGCASLFLRRIWCLPIACARGRTRISRHLLAGVRDGTLWYGGL